MHVPRLIERKQADCMTVIRSDRVRWVYDSESSRARIASLNGLYVSRVNEVACNQCRVNKLRPRVEVRWCAQRSVWGCWCGVWCGVVVRLVVGGVWLD